MKEGSRVAVLLSVYNGETYIADLLESLLGQKFKNFDLYVRDDGSQDSTVDIIKSYSDLLRIFFIRSDENMGPARSFVEILENVSDDYFLYMFCDQDDWWKSEKIERAFNAFRLSDPDKPFLYCSALDIVDDSLNFLKKTPDNLKPSKYNSLVENIATGCTVAINASARGLIVKNLPKSYLMHDWWFYIVVSFFGVVHFDAVSSIRYRQHNLNEVGAASSFWSDFVRRFKRFFSDKKKGVFSISFQASAFLNCYGSYLSENDVDVIKKLSNKNLKNNLWLVFFSPFLRQRVVDNIILRLLYLMGKY